jgi:hypothetical protein
MASALSEIELSRIYRDSVKSALALSLDSTVSDSADAVLALSPTALT